MFIVYTCKLDDVDELLVTTKDLEEKFIKQWFAEGLGRDINDYKRTTHRRSAVQITTVTTLAL